MGFVEFQEYENPKHLKLSKPLLILGEPGTSQKKYETPSFSSKLCQQHASFGRLLR